MTGINRAGVVKFIHVFIVTTRDHPRISPWIESALSPKVENGRSPGDAVMTLKATSEYAISA